MPQEQTHHGKLIDQLRKDRLMSRPDLVEGIMSLRNYQRFASGAISIPNEKFHQLIDKLNMDVPLFNSYINESVSQEYDKLMHAKKLAVQFQVIEAKTVLATVDKDNLKYSYHRFLYNSVEVLLKRSLNGNDTNQFYIEVEQLINFPNILEYKAINLTEFNMLVLLNSKYYLQGDRRIIDFLYENLHSRTYISHTNYDQGINLCYSSIARGLYKLGEYDECLKVCNEGIEEVKAKHFVTGFDNLLGYKALSLEKLLQHNEAIETAIELFMFLKSYGTEEHLDVYMKSMENNLDIKIENYIKLKRDL